MTKAFQLRLYHRRDAVNWTLLRSQWVLTILICGRYFVSPLRSSSDGATHQMLDL